MTSVRLAILADDLTGALDAAAPFAGRGLPTVVATDRAGLAGALALAPEVIAVTTASRDLPGEDARARVAEVLKQLPAGVRVFKKIDSRLKGNIEAELSAIPFVRALIVPAIPDFGRIVAGGAVRGFGVETPIPIAGQLGALALRADIPDTATREDIGQAVATSDADLLVGARGLAEALARTMTARDDRPVRSLPGPEALFIVGSRDPITLAQVEALRARPGTGFLGAPNGRTAGRAEGPCILLQALPGGADATGQAVAQALAETAHPTLTRGARTLLLTGGATAEAVLGRMGIRHVILRGECLPGLPVAEAAGMTIVAKSGGFGGPGTLCEVADMLGKA